MSFEIWLSFTLLVFLLVLTPGPSILIGMSHALRYGARPTLMTALGDVTANMIQMLIAALGVGAVLATSATAFAMVKWCGVGFLLVIGLMSFFRKPTEISIKTGFETNIQARFEAASSWRLFREGFLVAAGNPKAIAFFGALFPQFVDPAQPLALQLMILGATFVFLDYSFVMIYAMGAARVMPWLVRRGGNNVIARLSGGVLIVAAGLLALIEMPETMAGPHQTAEPPMSQESTQ
ncbi:LysE family translocator [Thalassospira sp. HF15]|uniref:LysE family translocator n=1 Tax=Thalassospira sp. HF15 TaxID=2722755 RepID=UPI001430AD73|nr:LysE family translocator [Thalassospira sp. HF15]NIY75819.1 LysE family translocator [Thalassospira sp. HF15]